MTRKSSSPTIADVAREAGVSTSTVSRILNESPRVADDTLDKVRWAIQRLGYSPHNAARNLALRRTNTLGMLLEAVGSPFFANVVAGVEEVANAAGYSLLIATPAPVQAGRRPALGPSITDGLMLASVQLSHRQLALYPSDYPMVSLYQPARRALGIPLITVDNKQGAFQLIEHLIRVHGLTRIAFLRGPRGNYDSRQREAGYRQALKKYGLPVDERLIEPGSYSCPPDERAVQRWLAHSCLPQAIFGWNDDDALEAMLTLYSAGVRVPQDVAVVGFDDARFAPRLVPPLTTVRAPGIEVGREAARQLLSAMHTGETTPLTLLPIELVIRRSCGCCPAPETMLQTDLSNDAPASLAGSARTMEEKRR